MRIRLLLVAIGLGTVLNVTAQVGLGESHPDWSPELKSVITRAYQGEPTALYLLGSLFFDGTDSVKQDKHTALRIFDIAAKAGSSDAEFRLAKMYLTGDGIATNEDKGIYFLKRAADHGVPLAQYRLGTLYETGVDDTKDSTPTIPQDLVTACMWFSLCADGEDQCATARKDLTEQMTPRQIQEATAATTQWKSEHYH